MIEFGVDVNVDVDGSTPLHIAADCDRAGRAIDILVEAGANMEARDSLGQTPLNANADNIDAVRPLLSHGADVNTQDNQDRAPLHHALGAHEDWDDSPSLNMNGAETVDLMLKAGADETMLDDEGRTPAEIYITKNWTWEGSSRRDAKKEIVRACGLLASAPADRRWRRRALLVMCIARYRREEVQLMDEPAGATSDNWARVAAWVLDAGLEMGMEGVFRTIVGYL